MTYAHSRLEIAAGLIHHAAIDGQAGNNMNRIPVQIPPVFGTELGELQATLTAGWVSTAAPVVTRFERLLEDTLRAKAATVLNSGTSALHLACLASGLQQGDLALVPTLTFIAPVNVVRYVGADPIFLDCDEHLCLSSKAVAAYIQNCCVSRGRRLLHKASGRTIRAILPVHLFGNPADMQPLLELAAEYELAIIEDASQALGASWRGKHLGTIGTAGCLSFNGNKILTTGSGGAVLSEDLRLIDKVRYLSTQAKDDARAFVHNQIGFNARMNALSAAMGCAQLPHLAEVVAAKKAIYVRYRDAFAQGKSLKLIAPPPESEPNFWMTTLVLPDVASRKRLQAELDLAGIETRQLWQLNHVQIPYRACETGDLSTAKDLAGRCLNLPSSSMLTLQDQNRVIAEVLRCSCR